MAKQNKLVRLLFASAIFAAGIWLMILGGVNTEQTDLLMVLLFCFLPIMFGLALMAVAFILATSNQLKVLRKMGIVGCTLAAALIIILGAGTMALTEYIKIDRPGCCEISRIMQQGLPVSYFETFYSIEPTHDVVYSSSNVNHMVLDGAAWTAIYAYISYVALSRFGIKTKRKKAA